MSYDIRIGAKIEGYQGKDGIYVIGSPDLDSPTYNLGRMFRECTGWDYNQGQWYKCSTVIGLIERGIDELSNNAAEYRQYEMPNGWGKLSEALDVLISLRLCIYEFGEDIPLDKLYMRW